MSHCVYDTHYHIVFPVKYRKSLLVAGVPEAIAEIATEIGERYDIDFENVGFDQNHIHLLCSFSPTEHSGGDVVGIFKSITAKQLFLRFPQLRKILWGGKLWAAGYYFATVGARGDLETVRRYVKNQGKEMGETLQLTILL